MSQPFLGEIKMGGWNFPPRGYAFCRGQSLSISQNSALFALLGTTYGGDGVTNFNVPDLRGRLNLHFGQGPGLTNRVQGEKGGVETVTLTTNQLPSHTHTLAAAGAPANPSNTAAGNFPGKGLRHFRQLVADTSLAPKAVTSTGGSQAHENMMPFLALNYVIALNGIFPSQN